MWVTTRGDRLQKASGKSLTKEANSKLVSTFGHKLFTVKDIQVFVGGAWGGLRGVAESGGEPLVCLTLDRNNTKEILC